MTFMSALDESCNVLNALFAAERGSAVMQSVIAAIKDWYRNPNTTRPKKDLMGTATMLGGLNDVVSRECPLMNIKNQTHLQRACGSHHQFRLYKEQLVYCLPFPIFEAECPPGRKKNYFEGTKFGLFDPGTAERHLVAWSRFENCTGWGCNQRLQASAAGAAPGACPKSMHMLPLV